MYTILVIIHTLACLALILIVLLQKGKGADMGAAFGGASQTLFGGSGGGTFLGKLTTGAAVVFMLTCLSLSYFAIRPDSASVMDKIEVEVPAGPAIPDAKPVMPMPEQSSATPAEPAAPGTAAVDPGQAAPAGDQAAPGDAPAGAEPAAGQQKQ